MHRWQNGYAPAQLRCRADPRKDRVEDSNPSAGSIFALVVGSSSLLTMLQFNGCISLVWSKATACDAVIAGSNPVYFPKFLCSLISVARMLPLHGRGQEFESLSEYHFYGSMVQLERHACLRCMSLNGCGFESHQTYNCFLRVVNVQALFCHERTAS